MFMIATVPISMHQIWQHLTHFVEPRQQSQIVRIIMTVPVYSFAAYASLRWYEYAMQINLCREIYEAYVIYCFLQYLIHYLDEKRDLSELLALRPATHGGHTFPFCCLPTWSMGAEFLDRVRTGVVQVCVLPLYYYSTAAATRHHVLALFQLLPRCPRASYCYARRLTCLPLSPSLSRCSSL